MALTRHFLFLALLFHAFVCTSVQAEVSGGSRGKLGLDLKGFKSNLLNKVGWIGGLRAAHFFGTSQFYMGVAAYFGTPTGNTIAREKMYYGGITMGLDGRLSKVFIYEIGLLGGYGEGQIDELSMDENSYYVVEPSIGVGFSLGLGWRIIFSGSYIHMARAPYLSGPTFGIRLDYKSITQVKDFND